jgi:hypothetical protein
MILELLLAAFKRFIWNPFVSPFRNEIIVDIHPGVFSFSTNGASFQLRTYVYLSGERPHRVLAVGQDYVGEAVKRLDLFEHRPSDPALPDKGKLLDAFFHNAFVRMPRGRTLVRPTVKFRGLSSLDSLLHGYQAMLFTDSVMRCGAHKVYVESGGDFVETTPRSAADF